jgi:hypothetical protein
MILNDEQLSWLQDAAGRLAERARAHGLRSTDSLT